MSAIDYRQIVMKAVDGWTSTTAPGTTAIINIGGTTGTRSNIYLTDIMISLRNIKPGNFYVHSGVGTVIDSMEFPGTSVLWSHSFRTYPCTTDGTNMIIVADAPHGTVSLTACGFSY